MKRVVIIIGLLVSGCVREKIKEVDYCMEHPDAPECKIPEDPCSLYPDLYFYCVNLPPEEFCKKYPELDICQELTPEYVCQKHPEWSICQPLPPNYPPVITLTISSRCGQFNDVITIDASGSRDPDGDSITFSWEILSGSGEFVSPLTSVVNFRFSNKEEDVIIMVRADDGRGGESEETINLISMGDGIFVDTNGNDSNPGRFNEPVSSIARALDIAYSSGITEVKILDGTYEGGIDIKKGGISIKGGYYREPDGCIRRDFENYYTIITSPITASPSYVFNLTSPVTDLVVFDGVYMEGVTSGATSEVFAIRAVGAYGFEIRNSYIYGGDGPRVRAVYAYAVTNISLIKSRVYGGNSSTIAGPPNLSTTFGRGGVILGNIQNVLIDSSIIDAGKSVGSSTTTGYIFGLYVQGVTNCSVLNSSIYGGTGYNSDNSGAPDFVTTGFATNSACEVYHNHIHGGHPVESMSATIKSGYSYGVYLLSGASTGIKIINNIIDPGGADAVVANTSGRYGVYDYGGIAPNYIFKNNDIYSTLPYMPGELPIIYRDGASGTSYTDISTLNSLDGDGGNFDGNLSIDPIFDSDGIHISPISPLIDAGYPGSITEVLPEYDIDGDIRPIGNLPDIGPDEVKR